MEVLVTGAILLAVLLPIIQLSTTASTEAVVARDRCFAINVASGVVDELAARGPAAVSADEQMAVTELPMFRSILEAHQREAPAAAAATAKWLSGFRCKISPRGPRRARNAEVTVEWTQSGAPRSYTVRGSVLAP